MRKKRILFVSGLFSTDRIIQYFAKNNLLDEFQVEVWSQNTESLQQIIDIPVKYFSLDIRYGRRSVPRRVRKWQNRQFDHKHYSYFRKVTSDAQKPAIQFPPKFADSIASWAYKQFGYSKNFASQFDAFNPDEVVLMWPYDMSNVNVAAYAKKKGKKTTAFITGFDNISTKSRIPDLYDQFLAWSTTMKQELLDWYPKLTSKQIKVVGAPQFDILVDERFHISKEEFCEKYELNPEKKTLLFCVGSPNLLDEVETFLQLYRQGVFQGFQVILRLHPGFRYNDTVIETVRQIPEVRLQGNNNDKQKHAFQGIDQLHEWAATFKHTDALINTSSTVCLDAAIFHKPIFNLNFELGANGVKTEDSLIHEWNQNWFHLHKMLKHTCIVKVDEVQQLQDALHNWSSPNDCSALLYDFFDDTLGKSSQNFVNALKDEK